MQSLLSVHQRVGPDDVDQAAGVSFHFIQQECQIVELALDRDAKQSEVTQCTRRIMYLHPHTQALHS